MAGKFTRAAHLRREITQIKFRVKRWHKKYWLKIESHKFGLNYVLIKSNRTALQTYKVEERTFGTPCNVNSFKAYIKTYVFKTLYWWAILYSVLTCMHIYSFYFLFFNALSFIYYYYYYPYASTTCWGSFLSILW